VNDRAGEQRLEVHDLGGRLLRTLERGWRAAGTRRVAWDGRDRSGERVPSGVYLVTLVAGDQAVRTRVAVLR
jgi:flagellar hook assembly protein FlgD